jgi:hypothetical protein
MYQMEILDGLDVLLFGLVMMTPSITHLEMRCAIPYQKIIGIFLIYGIILFLVISL